ncbi:Transforming growth factor-beta receptor-associated protein [Coccomyxa sp. Obi]|nr:Transforming growth factor-beta receptor-associated protein [Coccomyxa sp. Obi]
MAEGSRTAFELWPALDHKSKQSVISAIAVDDAARYIYLGTSDGQLSEHRIQSTFSGVRVSLGARKHVGKKPVTAILHVAIAKRLAVVCDGSLLLLDYESLEEYTMPGLKGVTAIALDTGAGLQSRLAVAVRTSKRSVRVLVYEIVPGVGLGTQIHSQPAICLTQAELLEPLYVKAMAWLGRHIVVVTSLRYMLFDPTTSAYTELFAVSPEAPPPTMVQAVPSVNQAVLLMDQVGIVTDEAGQPAQSALTFPSTPAALAASEIYVLAACADGVHVYDRTTAAWVQSLPYPGGLRTAPGQQLYTAHNPSGSVVLVAGYRRVWLLKPVALEDQARELLRACNYDQALCLAELCASEGAAWAEVAFAEAAFMLMQELRFREAMDALQHCSTLVVQPAELFPLFPEETQPWAAVADRAPSRPRWGLHPPLIDLRSLVRQRMAADAAAEPLENGAGDDAEQRLADAARQCVADYLLEVRQWEGVEHLDGVDTLLVRLLAAAHADWALEAFAAGPNEARLDLLHAPLSEARRYHVLALLSSNHGDAAAALRLWRGIADGSLAEAAAENGEVAFAWEGGPAAAAIHRATALMLDESRVSESLALEYLPWLLASLPEQSLAVLKGRELPAETVLPLLRGVSRELCCQYLEYLVGSKGSQDPAHHTELALGLADAALRLMPPIDTSVPAWERAKAARERMAEDSAAAARQREVRDKLCGLLEESVLYDARAVLQRCADTELWDEQVVLHSKLEDHKAALRILALVLGDIRLAEAYCARWAGQQGYLALLDMLLHPGDGRAPLYAEACHLLAAQGANVDARKVLDALSEDMPLGVAVDVLARMLRTAIHNRRSASIARNLHRSLHLSVAAERAELMQRSVVSTEERACRVCHTRISTKMFAVYPNGVLVCFKCFRQHGEPNICPLTGRDFRMPEPATSSSGSGL